MVLNEIDAFCVALPADLCPFTGQHHLRYLAVVDVEGVGHRPVGRYLPFEPSTYLIRTLCVERAVDAVDGTLIVRGQRVTPEAYLQAWRDRLAQPLSLLELAERKHLQAIAVFEWRHSAAIENRKATWVQPPYPTFGELLRARGCSCGAPCHSGLPSIRRLEIDLAAPTGARDAWWADDFLSALSQDDQVITRRVDLRPAQDPGSPDAERSCNLRPAMAGANQ
jgi:hypothetical protein